MDAFIRSWICSFLFCLATIIIAIFIFILIYKCVNKKTRKQAMVIDKKIICISFSSILFYFIASCVLSVVWIVICANGRGDQTRLKQTFIGNVTATDDSNHNYNHDVYAEYDSEYSNLLLLYLTITGYAFGKLGTYWALILRLYKALSKTAFNHNKYVYILLIVVVFIDVCILATRLFLLHYNGVDNWYSIIFDILWFIFDTLNCVLITYFTGIKLYQVSKMMHQVNNTSFQLSFGRVRTVSEASSKVKVAISAKNVDSTDKSCATASDDRVEAPVGVPINEQVDSSQPGVYVYQKHSSSNNTTNTRKTANNPHNTNNQNSQNISQQMRPVVVTDSGTHPSPVFTVMTTTTTSSCNSSKENSSNLNEKSSVNGNLGELTLSTPIEIVDTVETDTETVVGGCEHGIDTTNVNVNVNINSSPSSSSCFDTDINNDGLKLEHAAAHRLNKRGPYSDDISSMMAIIIRGTVFCMLIVVWSLIEVICKFVFDSSMEMIWLFIAIDCALNTSYIVLYFGITTNIYLSICHICHFCVISLMTKCVG